MNPSTETTIESALLAADARVVLDNADEAAYRLVAMRHDFSTPTSI